MVTKVEAQVFRFLRGWYGLRAGLLFTWADGEIIDAVQFADAKTKERAIAQTMDKLPESWRKVLRLLCFEGLTVREAAEVMDVSRQYLRTLRGLGLRRFRALWKKKV